MFMIETEERVITQ